MNPNFRHTAFRLSRVFFRLFALVFLCHAGVVCAFDEGTNASPRWPPLNEVRAKWDGKSLAEIEQAANANDLTAQHYLGFCYTDSGRFGIDLQKGVTWYERAGKGGYMPSYANLALVFQREKIVPRDDARAFRYNKLAADGGFANGLVGLGIMYRDGIGVRWDEAEAVRLFREAENRGSARAMFMLYLAYREGKGVRTDYAVARNWLIKGAEAGDADAQVELGYGYEHVGYNPTNPPWINMPEAVKWYRLSADKGNPVAEYCLGRCYLAGKGVELDEEQGLEWVRKSADQNHADALNELARLYEHGIGEPRNEQDRPTQILCKAARLSPGDTWLYGEIISRFQYGPAADRDPIAAAQWYCRAAINAGTDSFGNVRYSLTDVDKQLNLPQKSSASSFTGSDRPIINIEMPPGFGLSDQTLKVFSIYLKAARSNDAASFAQLGSIYLEGQGVAPSPAKAWPFFTLAAQNGDSRAGEKIATIEASLTKEQLDEAKRNLPVLVQELRAIAGVR